MGKKWELYREICWEDVKEGKNLKYLGVDISVLLKRILNKLNGKL